MGSWLFGAGKSTDTSGPSSALRIQSSMQGVIKPIVWGQARIAGNLIWYGDFRATAHQQSGGKGGGGSGGKGGGGVTYTYNVSFALGLCEGPIADILTCWRNKDVGTAASMGLTKFLGGYAQSPWGTLSSLHPDQALNYHGDAYVAAAGYDLGSTDSLQQFGLEILSSIANAIPGNPGADPRDVIVDFLTNDKYGVGFPAARLDTSMTAYSAYCRATGMVVSPALTDQKEASALLSDLLDATNSSARWSGGVLTVVPWGDEAISANGAAYAPELTPLYDITEDDLLPNQGSAGAAPMGAPIVAVRKRRSDMLNNIKVEFLDRANNYDPSAAVEAKDEAAINAFGLRASDLKQLHFFCDAVAARMSAHLMLIREQIPNTYVFTLGPKFILVDVEDLLTLSRETMGLDRQPVRVTEIQENSDGTLTFTAEEFLGTAGAPLYGVQASSGHVNNTNADPGPVNPPIIFEPTDQLGGGLQVWGAVSGQDTDLWGGCTVWASYDDINYTMIGELRGAARMGRLTAPIATTARAPTGPTIDTFRTLAVDLSESAGALISVGDNDLHAFNTACYVDGEIIAFQTANLTGPSAYVLSTLNRGGYGSEIGGHAADAPFARLDQGIFKFAYDPGRIGALVYFKFASFNLWGGGRQSLADVPAYHYTITGSALASPLPKVANLTTKFVDGRLNIAWDEISDFRSGILYELRKGPEFNTALLLGFQAHPPFTVFSGDGTYWITGWCQPSSGLIVRSGDPSSITITGSALTRNVIAEYDLKDLGWPGTFDNTVVDSGLDAVRSGDGGNILDEDDVLSLDNVLNLGGSISGVYDPGIVIDIGRLDACPVLVTWQGGAVPADADVLSAPDFLSLPDVLAAASVAFVDVYAEIAVSTDGATFGDWMKYTPGTFYGRAFKVRFQLATFNAQIIALLQSAVFAVDVPDRTDNPVVNGTVPDTGLAITFTPDGAEDAAPFNGGPNGSAVPQLMASWGDEAAGDVLEVTDLTTAGCTVTIKNAGVGVTRDHVNIFVRGW